MATDLYQLTMMYGYFKKGTHKDKVVFDVTYRKNPFGNGYAIFSGLETVIDYIKKIEFTYEDILYLRSLNKFSEEFLDYLANFRFTGEIYAMPEGSVVFPYEPLIRVCADRAEAQFVETTILTLVNHQSLIATKAARICVATEGQKVLEFGARRAQGIDAGVYGARAAVIGGFAATSNMLAGQMFDIPVTGTMAHSWIMGYDDELEAFREFAEVYPNNTILLVDTYNTLKSGVPNAIKVFQEMFDSGKWDMYNRAGLVYGIRLDSGDLAYLSKMARKMLDEAGFPDALICASSDLDENLISTMKAQGSRIDVWAVGTKLITAYDCPALGGVYKIAAEIEEDKVFGMVKISENPEKITNPGYKKIVRFYQDGHIKADLICMDNEVFDPNEDIELKHELHEWMNMTLKGGTYSTKFMLEPIFVNGSCVYKRVSVIDIQKYCKAELETLWDETKRLVNPQPVPVDLSDKLREQKIAIIKSAREKTLAN
jgi:nicotinate phosphoribosyltransferase